MNEAKQLDTSAVAGLDPSEQLQLASLILEGLKNSPSASYDVSDNWTVEDIRDETIASLENAVQSMGEV